LRTIYVRLYYHYRTLRSVKNKLVLHERSFSGMDWFFRGDIVGAILRCPSRPTIFSIRIYSASIQNQFIVNSLTFITSFHFPTVYARHYKLQMQMIRSLFSVYIISGFFYCRPSNSKYAHYLRYNNDYLVQVSREYRKALSVNIPEFQLFYFTITVLFLVSVTDDLMLEMISLL